MKYHFEILLTLAQARAWLNCDAFHRNCDACVFVCFLLFFYSFIALRILSVVLNFVWINKCLQDRILLYGRMRFNLWTFHIIFDAWSTYIRACMFDVFYFTMTSYVSLHYQEYPEKIIIWRWYEAHNKHIKHLQATKSKLIHFMCQLNKVFCKAKWIHFSEKIDRNFSGS